MKKYIYLLIFFIILTNNIFCQNTKTNKFEVYGFYISIIDTIDKCVISIENPLKTNFSLYKIKVDSVFYHIDSSFFYKNSCFDKPLYLIASCDSVISNAILAGNGYDRGGYIVFHENKYNKKITHKKKYKHGCFCYEKSVRNYTLTFFYGIIPKLILSEINYSFYVSESIKNKKHMPTENKDDVIHIINKINK